MDFVDWCDTILENVVEASKDPNYRPYGVPLFTLAERVYGPHIVHASEYPGSTREQAIADALNALSMKSFVQCSSGNLWKPFDWGRDHLTGRIGTWQAVCEDTLDEGRVLLLRLVNQHSVHVEGDHVWLEEVNLSTILADPEWSGSSDLLVGLADELAPLLIEIRPFLGSTMLRSTYDGVVWETRADLTLWTRFLDGLIDEWETTSVDFKRELVLVTNDNKVEFIKDILALADTLVSGRRWMIIGVDNSTRALHTPPDPKITQDRLEQIVDRYIAPSLDIRYRTVQYRDGTLGILEVLPDRTKLPYRVKKALTGQKKSMHVGDLFVRHGSHVVKPDAEEEQAMIAEAEYATERSGRSGT